MWMRMRWRWNKNGLCLRWGVLVWLRALAQLARMLGRLTPASVHHPISPLQTAVSSLSWSGSACFGNFQVNVLKFEHLAFLCVCERVWVWVCVCHLRTSFGYCESTSASVSECACVCVRELSVRRLIFRWPIHLPSMPTGRGGGRRRDGSKKSAIVTFCVCNVNGNCAAGQSLSQSALLPKYTHTHAVRALWIVFVAASTTIEAHTHTHIQWHTMFPIVSISASARLATLFINCQAQPK